MATPGVDTQADIITKHKIVLYSKLKTSYHAQDKVQQLLEEILLEDHYMVECVIEKYNEKPVYSDAMRFAATTAIVVLDARQTRVLITPVDGRRDKTVDLWDELDSLNCNLTEPKGSILLVIYGDKFSTTLEKTKLMADKWLNVWLHSDPIANNFAQRGRCLTLWDKFNKQQRGRLMQFLREQPVLPNARQNVNTLVFGDPRSNSVLNPHLKEHPLLNYVSEKSLTPARLHEVRHGIPSYKQGRADDPEYCFTSLHCDLDPINVCREGFDFRKDFPLTARNFKEWGIANMDVGCFPHLQMLVGQSPLHIPDIDNVVLVCHCERCFFGICKNTDLITRELKKALGEVQILLKGEVIPVPPKDTPMSQEIVDKVRLLVRNLASKDHGVLFEHRETKIEREKPECVLKLLVWYACQTSIGRESGLQVAYASYLRSFSPWEWLSSVWNYLTDKASSYWRRRSDGSKQDELRRPLLEGESSIIDI
ncbi:uncharacterized protein [Ptychodera flava]|uniref:uncharacterized protein n=1 Tax=Ptychodera flava TaxID=63121 RepID=UPI00396A88F8